MALRVGEGNGFKHALRDVGAGSVGRLENSFIFLSFKIL
jgi:hypothetical protein